MSVVWPEYISLTDWSSRLIADFNQEQLPLLDDEHNWEEWGTTVASTGIFERAGVPAPFDIEQGEKTSLFPSWEEWAKTVYMLILDTELLEKTGHTNGQST